MWPQRLQKNRITQREEQTYYEQRLKKEAVSEREACATKIEWVP